MSPTKVPIRVSSTNPPPCGSLRKSIAWATASPIQTIAMRNQNREFVAEVMDAVYAVASTLATDDAIARLEAETVPCGVVESPADIVNDEHPIAVDRIENHDHPASGRVRQPLHPAQFARTPARLSGRAPLLGEHTDEVLAELGYDGATIADLRASGAVG